MDCKRTYKYICENLDVDLNSPACAQIKKHLDDCPNCMAYLDTLKKTILLYQEYDKPELRKSPKERLKYMGKLSNISKKQITNK
jgi:predicted anti-sigma-YlaC factor YlaD